jgi:hypothetical protein
VRATGVYYLVRAPATERPVRLDVMIASDAVALTVAATADAMCVFEGSMASVTVTGVVAGPDIFEFAAGCAGMVMPGSVLGWNRDNAMAAAKVCACSVADAVPSRHRVAEGWGEALRMAREYDAIVIPVRTRRPVDRWRVSRWAAPTSAR